MWFIVILLGMLALFVLAATWVTRPPKRPTVYRPAYTYDRIYRDHALRERMWASDDFNREVYRQADEAAGK